VCIVFIYYKVLSILPYKADWIIFYNFGLFYGEKLRITKNKESAELIGEKEDKDGFSNWFYRHSE
jgi:hypothetical protein